MRKVALIDWSTQQFGGVPTYMNDCKIFAEEYGIELDIYFYKTGRKPRNFEIIQSPQNGTDWNLFSKADIESLFEKLESYDFVAFHPSPNHKNFKREERAAILQKYKDLKVTKGIQSHDFPNPAIWLCNDVLDYVAASDVIFARPDDNTPYWVYGSKLGKTMIPLTLYADLDRYIDDTPKKPKLLYRGRNEGWKGPQFMGPVSEFLTDTELEYELMGIDCSIMSLALHKEDWVESYRFPDKKGGRVKITPPFKHADGIEEMKKSMFGFHPRYRLSGIYLEYPQVEILQCGGIPIFHKAEGEHSTTKDGTRWIDIPYFAIWLDPEKPEETAAEIRKVLKDDELQQLYRTTAKKYLKEIMDKSLFNEHIDIAINAPKSRDQVGEDILKAFHWPQEKIEEYQYHLKHHIPVPWVKLLEEKEVYIFTEKSRKPYVASEVMNGNVTRKPNSM